MKTPFNPGDGLLRLGEFLTIACVAMIVCLSCSKDAVQAPENPPWYGVNDFFVSSTIGDSTNTGAINSPFDKIQDAIEAASAAGGGTVHIAAGTYTENFALRSKVNVYGGYSDVGFERDVNTYVTQITGGPRAVFGNNADSLTINGVTVTSLDISAQQPGISSIAIHLHDCTDVIISGNVITAGAVLGKRDGADGAPGADGETGDPGLSGVVGGPGGDGGSLTAGCDGGKGGVGAYGVASGARGSQGACGGALGGAGGAGGTLGGQAGIIGGLGDDGAPGGNGVNGTNVGTVYQAGYLPAHGTNGDPGADGKGGGGGGGGGGLGGLLPNRGGGGGGGGEGGTGGGEGQGGVGGGASIAVLLTGNSNDITVTENTISTSQAGGGGDGGQGKTAGGGGAGGAGGPPGGSSPWWAGWGGPGGKGGSGSDGGHGGAGGGGPSIGILVGPDAGVTNSDNTFTVGNAGQGGTSGWGLGAPAGVKAEVHFL
jgi:hypothetical protein